MLNNVFNLQVVEYPVSQYVLLLVLLLYIYIKHWDEVSLSETGNLMVLS